MNLVFNGLLEYPKIKLWLIQINIEKIIKSPNLFILFVVNQLTYVKQWVGKYVIHKINKAHFPIALQYYTEYTMLLHFHDTYSNFLSWKMSIYDIIDIDIIVWIVYL